MSFAADLKDFVNTYTQSKHNQALESYYGQNKSGGGDPVAWDRAHEQLLAKGQTEDQILNALGPRPGAGAQQPGGIIGSAVRGISGAVRNAFNPPQALPTAPASTGIRGPGPNVSDMYDPNSETGKTATAWAKFAKEHGYSPIATAALGGNFGHESGWNPTISGDKGTSFGLAQLHNERKAEYLKFAQDNKLDPKDPNSQFPYIDHELRNNYPKLFDQLQKSKSVPEATFLAGKYYENPQGAPAATYNNPSAMSGWNSRLAHANAFSNTIIPGIYGNTAPVTGTATPNVGTSYAQNQQQLQTGAQPGSPLATTAMPPGGALPVSAPTPVSMAPLASPTQQAGDNEPYAARGGPIRKQAINLASKGRRGDTMIAHINPREAVNASGINPDTGLPEFWEPGPGGPGADATGWGGGVLGGGQAPNDFSGAVGAPINLVGADLYPGAPTPPPRPANLGPAYGSSAADTGPAYGGSSAVPAGPAYGGYSQASTAGPYAGNLPSGPGTYAGMNVDTSGTYPGASQTNPASYGNIVGTGLGTQQPTYSNSVGDTLPASNLNYSQSSTAGPYGAVGSPTGASSGPPVDSGSYAGMNINTSGTYPGAPQPAMAASLTQAPEGVTPNTGSPYGDVGQLTGPASQPGSVPQGTLTLGNPPAGGTGYGAYSMPSAGAQAPQMQSQPAFGRAQGGLIGGYLGGGAVNGYAQGGEAYDPGYELARQGHFNARLHKGGFVPKNEKPIAHPSEISSAMAPRPGDTKDVWMGRLLGFEQHYPEFREYARLHHMNIPTSKGGTVGQIRNLIDGFLHWKHGAGAQQMFAGGKVTQYADGGVAQNPDDDTAQPSALPANAPYPQSSTAGPYAGSAPPPAPPVGDHSFGASSRVTQAGPYGRDDMVAPLQAGAQELSKQLQSSATSQHAILTHQDMPDPQTYAAAAKITGADQYPPVIAHTVLLNEMYKHDLEKGDVDAAGKHAAALLMYLRATSMQYGEAAVANLKAGDIQAAKDAIKDGYAHFPDGKYLDENGDEVAVKDLKTGDTYYKTKLTPNMIAQSALGLKDGSAFLQQLAQAGQDKLPGNKNKAKDNTPSDEYQKFVAGIGQEPGAQTAPASTTAPPAGAKSTPTTTASAGPAIKVPGFDGTWTRAQVEALGDDEPGPAEEDWDNAAKKQGIAPGTQQRPTISVTPAGSLPAGATTTAASPTAPGAVPGTPAAAPATAPAQAVPVDQGTQTQGFNEPEPPRAVPYDRAEFAALPKDEQSKAMALINAQQKEVTAEHKDWEKRRAQWEREQQQNKIQEQGEENRQIGEAAKQRPVIADAVDAVVASDDKSPLVTSHFDPTTKQPYPSVAAATSALGKPYVQALRTAIVDAAAIPGNKVDVNAAADVVSRFTNIDDADKTRRAFTAKQLKSGDWTVTGAPKSGAQGLTMRFSNTGYQALNRAIDARIAKYEKAGVFEPPKPSAASEGIKMIGAGMERVKKEAMEKKYQPLPGP
jgi:hypothetical protein